MKASLTLVLLGAVALFFLAFSTVRSSMNLATVDQEEGILLFIHSKPAGNYKFLGRLNMPEMVWNGRPSEMVNIAIRRARRQYPDANGIVIQSDNFGKVDAVKVEE